MRGTVDPVLDLGSGQDSSLAEEHRPVHPGVAIVAGFYAGFKKKYCSPWLAGSSLSRSTVL